MLSEQWDNTYLDLAVRSPRQAYDAEPDELPNATQLSRSMQRFAANPPQDTDPAWTEGLALAQERMTKAFDNNRPKLSSSRAIIPPANILSVISLDLATRIWFLSSKSKAAGDRALAILSETAIPTQGLILSELPNTEWDKDYTFDMNYDLGRMLLLKVEILDSQGDDKAEAAFSQARNAMRKAAVAAKRTQSQAALQDLHVEPIMSGLSPARRDIVRGIFTMQ